MKLTLTEGSTTEAWDKKGRIYRLERGRWVRGNLDPTKKHKGTWTLKQANW
jgi:hypothetical protein